MRSSAVLVSILSPNGLESNWCQQERQRFEQAAARAGGFRIDNAIRAFKVTKTPLPGDRHRSVFDTLGYEFYERLPNGRFTEFYPGTREFETVFDQFTQDVWERLNQLRTRALSPAPALTVYVASVPGDLESWREAIVQQLAAWSCRVLPEDPLPRASPRLRGAIDEALASCRLSIHCVGATRGFIAEGEESPVDVLQHWCERA